MMFSMRIGGQRSFSAWEFSKTPQCSRRSSTYSLAVWLEMVLIHIIFSPAARLQEERVMHEAKLAKMEAEMKMVFSQKVQEKESKLKQSEEELYARHKDMKDTLEKQRNDLEDKKRRLESGRPLTPEKGSVSLLRKLFMTLTHPLPIRLKGRRASFAARKTSAMNCSFSFVLSALDPLMSTSGVHEFREAICLHCTSLAILSLTRLS